MRPKVVVSRVQEWKLNTKLIVGRPMKNMKMRTTFKVEQLAGRGTKLKFITHG